MTLLLKFLTSLSFPFLSLLTKTSYLMIYKIQHFLTNVSGFGSKITSPLISINIHFKGNLINYFPKNSDY